MVVSCFRNRAKLEVGPTLADAGPRTTAKLRTANIQGFNILQWRSSPTRWTARLSYFNSLDYKPQFAPKNDALPHLSGPENGSDHGHSAVDVNRLAGDIACFVRGEVDGRGGNVLGRTEPACRNL